MMDFKICEIFCDGKSETLMNEDGYIITPDYIAVVDGATSKTGQIYDGLTGGARLRDSILNSIRDFDGSETMETAVRLIQGNILKDAPLDLCGPAAASALIYSIKRDEVWSVGDCRMRLDDEVYLFEKEIDRKISGLRSEAVKKYLAEGYSVDDLLEKDLSREDVMPLLRNQKELENSRSENGYCVFNNQTSVSDFPVDMVNCISTKGAGSLVLASDGYPEILPTLEQSEDRLMEIIDRDPLCYSIYPSTKGVVKGNRSFDDRTYIRLQFNK